jgi:hypothetical protein
VLRVLCASYVVVLAVVVGWLIVVGMLRGKKVKISRHPLVFDTQLKK